MQNSAGKKILMGKSTAVQFSAVGAAGLSSALAANFVMRQKLASRVGNKQTTQGLGWSCGRKS
jgi:hypothetical protein